MSLLAPPLAFPNAMTTAVRTAEAVQAAVLPSWQAVHKRLTACDTTDLAPISLANFAIYFYCVYQAFGRPADGTLTQQLAQRLVAQPWPAPASPWTAQQVDQACALAWLDTQYAAAGLVPVCPPAQLAFLDEALYQQARLLLAQSTPDCRRTLVRVARYLRLRLPAPTAGRYLHALLASWPQVLPAEETQPLLLGLVDGLAAELLGLMYLHKAGVQHSTIEARVQQGVRSLLAVKRGVDFLAQHYSVFPYQVCAPAQEGAFSAGLSWQRGDLGPAWVLYEAQAMLHDSELANMAELVGLNTILLTSVPATEVVCAGLYCGAAGVAQLYAQLYRTSRQPAYRTAYHFWLGRTQELLPSALAATSAVLATEDKIAGGLVGIGLVLLTAAKDLAVNWEAVMI